MRQGQFRLPTGSSPNRYRVDDHGNPYVYELAFEIVRRIFRKYAYVGVTVSAFTLQLAGDDAPLLTGVVEWRRARDDAILKNET